MSPAESPPAVIWMDEVQEALSAGWSGTDTEALIASLIRKGRAAGVVVTTCTSRPSAVRLARPACRCPDHPGEWLLPLPGGAARGLCPADGRSWQLGTPEVA